MSIKKTISCFEKTTFVKTGIEIKKDGFVLLLCDKYVQVGRGGKPMDSIFPAFSKE